MTINNDQKYLLALHSSTKNLGIAVLDVNDDKKEIKTLVVNAGNQLSNDLFQYVDKLLPKTNWQKIGRLAVATGPGSFTGTRLTIVMAKTLAQQLKCDLDGISSFALMAPRLSKSLDLKQEKLPFWIIQSLNKRGIVGGQYKIIQDNKKNKIIEMQKPHLLKEKEEATPAINAEENVSEDIIVLMNNCLDSFIENRNSRWDRITPLYPTSPVDNI